MRDTGSEMSCLMLRPSSACASGIDSRRCHSACDCSRLSATAASVMIAVLQRLLEQAPRTGCARAPRTSVSRLLQQHRPRRRRQRPGQLREVPRHQLERERVHHLEAGQAGARAVPAPAAAAAPRHRARRRAASAVMRAAGRGCSLMRRGGDDAERAFAADEEVAQVVAGVVLAQAREAVPYLALRRDHLEPQAQLARVAVAQHLRAAGVGGEVAADGAAAFGRQAQGEQQALRPSPPPAPPAARSRPRPSSSGWPRRCRGCGSAAAGSAAPACRWRRARCRRPGPCCRPAGPGSRHAQRRHAPRPRLPPWRPGAPPRAPCRDSACASPAPRPTGRLR